MSPYSITCGLPTHMSFVGYRFVKSPYFIHSPRSKSSNVRSRPPRTAFTLPRLLCCEQQRRSYPPGHIFWGGRIFFGKRCFLYTRIPPFKNAHRELLKTMYAYIFQTPRTENRAKKGRFYGFRAFWACFEGSKLPLKNPKNPCFAASKMAPTPR